MSKYFKNVKSYNELKSTYKELLKVNHPDNGGDLAKMQEINTEYDVMFKIWKDRAANRYNFIKTAPTKHKIKLYREKRYQEKVFYYIQFYDVNLVDGHEEMTRSIKYTGKERKQAIEHFEQLKKEKSNAIFEIDIEKRSWER